MLFFFKDGAVREPSVYPGFGLMVGPSLLELYPSAGRGTIVVYPPELAVYKDALWQ